MIEWLTRQPPEAVFLKSEDGVFTYGDIAERVRAAEPVETIWPDLDVDSVVSILAAANSGTAVLLGPGHASADHSGLAGAEFVVFTSGTSGPPKGVRLTWSNWEAAAAASVTHLGHGHEDTWLLAMPLHHVAGLGVILRSAYAGGSVRMLGRFDPVAYGQALREATLASVVPAMLSRVLDVETEAYRGLKAVLVGGGPVPAELLERAHAAGIPALPTYGLSETCGQVATLRPGSSPARKAHLLPGVEARIGPEERIHLRGPMVSPGYLGEPDRPPGQWLVTGDRGRLDGDELVVLGRVDDLIITGGENVDPSHVEQTLGEHPEVEGALVVGVPDETWGEIVGCLYVGDVQEEGVEGWARSRLPTHAVPRLWRRVREVPTTTLGKPDRLRAREILSGISAD